MSGSYKDFLENLNSQENKVASLEALNKFDTKTLEINDADKKEIPQFTKEYENITNEIYKNFSSLDPSSSEVKKEECKKEEARIAFSKFNKDADQKEIENDDNDKIDLLIERISKTIDKKKQNAQIVRSAKLADTGAISAFLGV